MSLSYILQYERQTVLGGSQTTPSQRISTPVKLLLIDFLHVIFFDVLTIYKKLIIYTVCLYINVYIQYIIFTCFFNIVGLGAY